MIAIVHPVVRRIRAEYDILRSLINDLPSLYEGLADEIEARAKEDATAAADGDYEIYDTVYHSYNSAIDFAYEVPDQSRGYILAAIYAYYERNVQNIFKELKVSNYSGEKMTAQNVFTLCNIPIDTHQQLFDDIKMLGLIRNNLSHGRLNNEDNWNSLVAFVANNQSLEMNDDIVYISDTKFLMRSLNAIQCFFDGVFGIHSEFATRYFGGQK